MIAYRLVQNAGLYQRIIARDPEAYGELINEMERARSVDPEYFTFLSLLAWIPDHRPN